MELISLQGKTNFFEKRVGEYQKAPRQKSTSKAKPLLSSWPEVVAMTPAFWYSPTRFSKKFVFPWSDISSIQSNGFDAPNSFECPSAVRRRSATNSMYLVI